MPNCFLMQYFALPTTKLLLQVCNLKLDVCVFLHDSMITIKLTWFCSIYPIFQENITFAYLRNLSAGRQAPQLINISYLLCPIFESNGAGIQSLRTLAVHGFIKHSYNTIGVYPMDALLPLGCGGFLAISMHPDCPPSMIVDMGI
jgi:hypothetical protein